MTVKKIYLRKIYYKLFHTIMSDKIVAMIPKLRLFDKYNISV